VESVFGRLTFTSSFEDSTARFQIELAFDRPRVNADEYSDFRAFLESIDDALNQVFETEVNR
jgi:hypothetical protein